MDFAIRSNHIILVDSGTTSLSNAFSIVAKITARQRQSEFCICGTRARIPTKKKYLWPLKSMRQRKKTILFYVIVLRHILVSTANTQLSSCVMSVVRKDEIQIEIALSHSIEIENKYRKCCLLWCECFRLKLNRNTEPHNHNDDNHYFQRKMLLNSCWC